MRCPSCGHEDRERRKFCVQCGAGLNAACPSCGAPAEPGERFCGECGEPLGEPPPSARTPTPEPAPSLPASFASGRYQVQRFIGEGGKKRVYLARDDRLDRDVAVGIIKTEGLDEAGRARVRREAQAMGRLGDHPNVVTIFDIGEEAGQPFIVSEHMEGGSVDVLIGQARDHRLSIEQTLQIASEVCQALRHAHDRGIIHRDVKPGNIWLTADGHARLGDFGLAVVLDLSRLTQAGMMVGTAAYMPPEQALGGKVDAKSDLYGLGASLYEMVCGRPPFSGHDLVAVVSQHVNTPPVAPSFHNSSLPPVLNDLILKLLAKDPEDRPSSADEILPALRSLGEQVERGEVVVTPAEPGAVAPIGRVAWGAFVGREREMDQLKERLADAFSGLASVAMVVGDAGIGKTRLLQEFATYARLRGAQVLWGAAYEGEATLPYGPFAEALRDYVSRTSVEILRQAVTEGSSVLAPLAPELKVKLPELADPSPVAPETEAYRLFQGVTEFLKNASASAPLVLVLEDLQWSEKGSCSLLQHLARRLAGSRLLVIVSCRQAELEASHPLKEALPQVRRESGFWELPLKGLRESEVKDLITVLAEHEIPQPLMLALHQDTEGNPFFVQETLKHLMETDALYEEGGRWMSKASTISQIGLPESVRDVMERRLSGLSEECRRLLQVGSVLGRRFNLSLAQRVAELEEEVILRAVEEALAAQVVREQRQERRTYYQFASTLLRENLYGRLSAPRRERLHLRAANALEEAYPDHLEDYAAELAYHYQEAGESAPAERAYHWTVKAGQRAARMYAHDEALSHFVRAVGMTERVVRVPAGELAELMFGKGMAQGGTGDWSGAADSFRQALPEYDAAGDREMAARVCGELCYLLTWRGRAQEAVDWADEGLTRVAAGSDESVTLIARKAPAHMLLNQASESLETAEMAASQVAGMSDVRMKSVIASTVGTPLIAYLACDRALSLATEGVAWGRAVHDSHTETSNMSARAAALGCLGRCVEAEELAERTAPLALKVGNLPVYGLARVILSICKTGKGEFDEGERQAEDVLQLAQEMGVVSALPHSLEAASAPKLFTGRFDEAEQRLKQLDVVFELAGRPAIAPSGWPRLVRLCLDRGDLEGAKEMLAAKPDWLSTKEPLDIRLAMGLANLADLYFELGQADEAVNLEHTFAGIVERGILLLFYSCFPLPYRLLGMINGVQSRWAEAEANFRRAMELCEVNDLRVELAATYRWYGQMLVARDQPGDTERATTLLDRALELYRDMNMKAYVERVLTARPKDQKTLEPQTVVVHGSAKTKSVALPSSIEEILPSALADAPSLARHSDERGTVTILFTDIERSTALAQRLGDRPYHALLAEHNRILREQIARHGGHEVKHTGDGFMVACASASRAVSCAVEIQRAISHSNADPESPIARVAREDSEVRVRIGLNTGESIAEAGDYFGTAVTVAARVADKAKGGQILVSEVVRTICGSLTTVEFRDAGRKQLKGIGRQRVYEVVWE